MDVLLIASIVILLVAGIAFWSSAIRAVGSAVFSLGAIAIVLALLAAAGWCCYKLWAAGHDNLGVLAAIVLGFAAIKLGNKFLG